MRIFIYSLIVATAVFCVYFWYTSPEWSKDAETEMKRSEAIDYCKKLKEPGHWDHTDWRLPTSSELSAKELDKNKYWASDSADEDTEAKMSVICIRNMPEKAEDKCIELCITKDFTWCSPTRSLSWEDADKYCRSIHHDGKTGWRMPDSNEFQDLEQNLDKCFKKDPPQRFWRSGGTEYYWDRFNPTGNGIVSVADSICVRKN